MFGIGIKSRRSTSFGSISGRIVPIRMRLFFLTLNVSAMMSPINTWVNQSGIDNASFRYFPVFEKIQCDEQSCNCRKHVQHIVVVVIVYPDRCHFSLVKIAICQHFTQNRWWVAVWDDYFNLFFVEYHDEPPLCCFLVWSH